MKNHPFSTLTRRVALAGGLGAVALLSAGCGGRISTTGQPGSARANGGSAFSGHSMGSSYTVKFGRPLSASAMAAAQQAVASALAQVVQLMSHYETGSEVARLNRQPLGRPLPVAAATLDVFAAAQGVHAASGGAFDVAIGRAVDDWGFGPSGKLQRVLDPGELAELRAQPRSGVLQIDPGAGTLTRHTGALFNLSGIAKGYAVDQAALALEALGLGDYMVELGGEIRTRGHNSRGLPWQLAIERPDALPQQALRLVPLSGLALATSGDYRNFFMHQGRRYSHEIDPGSAEPVAHKLASVSVVAADCTSADAWSTALFVLGPEQGLSAARRLGLAAHFVVRGGGARGGFNEFSSPAFDALGSRAMV